jgi:hypothetical protein
MGRSKKRSASAAEAPADPEREAKRVKDGATEASRAPNPGGSASVSRVRALEAEIQTSGSSKLNNLAEIMTMMGDGDTKLAKAALHALRRLFTTCDTLSSVLAASRPEASDDPNSKVEEIFRKWAQSKYSEYKRLLQENLNSADGDMARASVVVLLQLVKQESAASGAEGCAAGCASIVRALFQSDAQGTDGASTTFVKNFASEYDDVRFYTLKALKTLLAGIKAATVGTTLSKANANMVRRTAAMLLSIQMPGQGTTALDKFWCSSAIGAETKRDSAPKAKKGSAKKGSALESTEATRVGQARTHRKIFGDCWTTLLQVTNPTQTWAQLFRPC